MSAAANEMIAHRYGRHTAGPAGPAWAPAQGAGSPEKDVSQLGQLMNRLVIEMADLEEATREALHQEEDVMDTFDEDEDPEGYGLIWTILGIAGIVSISKRMEGKLRYVRRRIDKLHNKIARTSGQRRVRLLERVNSIQQQLDDMNRRLTSIKRVTA